MFLEVLGNQMICSITFSQEEKYILNYIKYINRTNRKTGYENVFKLCAYVCLCSCMCVCMCVCTHTQIYKANSQYIFSS